LPQVLFIAGDEVRRITSVDAGDCRMQPLRLQDG